MSSSWIPLSKVEGISSRQAHTDLPNGTFERELGMEGFYGPSTQMYHAHAPTGWTEINGPLKPRAFDTTKNKQVNNHPFAATKLLHNEDVSIRYWSSTEPMEQLARNSDGDELLFIHSGKADFYCDYGYMQITEGDYIVIPRGTLWRVDVIEALAVLLIQATNDHYRMPDKGLMGNHALFDPAMLETPKIDKKFKSQDSGSSHTIMVKRHDQLTEVRYPFNPLDAVGWHGNLMPVKINWRDIRPVMSHRYHLPPSVHTTFLSNKFVVCTFCPRPLETDPGALKIPFFHNNDDYDEVIFYHKGDFFSRDNIHPGMITLHPSGLTHGPHPKALQTGLNSERTMTDEVAVMIDTRSALVVDDSAEKIEWLEYVNSWKTSTEGKTK